MHKSGGFNLTEFLLNIKQVLGTVSACDRRKSCGIQVWHSISAKQKQHWGCF